MGTGSPPLDAVFDLLENHRRRRTLAVLKRGDRRLTVNDLTKEIAVREFDALITDIPGEDVRDVNLSLHHTHVPKIAAFDLVVHDRKRNTVEPTDHLERLEPHLSIATGGEFERDSRGDAGAL